MEKRISDLENKNIEIIQLEERELRSKKSKKKKRPCESYWIQYEKQD